MRTFAAVACILIAVGPPGAAASVARAPGLKLVDIAPVTFRGTGFAKREQVRVALTRNGRMTVRRTRASRSGAFTVSFGLLALEPCRGAIVVRATGGRGSRATYRRACRGD